MRGAEADRLLEQAEVRPIPCRASPSARNGIAWNNATW